MNFPHLFSAAKPAAPGPRFAMALAAISLIGPLAVHLFMPAIPAVKASLGLSDATAQLTFSISLFSMAFATLVYGSLSDRFGRRPVLLSGLGLFLVGSVISAAAYSLPELVIGRCVQAIGAGCGITLVRAIAQDVYGPSRLIKAIAYLTMAYTIGPMISPMIGGILIDAFGWRTVFVFALGIGGLIALGAYTTIFESRPPTPGGGGKTGNILQSYLALFRHVRFTTFVLQSGFCSASFMATATAASSLMKDVLHRPSSEFGTLFVLFPLGYLAGNFIATRVGNRITNETMVLAGSLLSVAAIAMQCSLILTGGVSRIALFAPAFFITFAQGISLSYAQAGAMETEPKLAGTAAGIGVFMQNFVGAVFAQLYGILADGTSIPLMQTTATSAILGLAAGLAPFLMMRIAWRTSWR